MSLDPRSSDASSVVHAADFDSEQSALSGLRTARPLLLQLHKALMEAARLSYESNYGPILSKGDYFRLVIDNEWFQWLRPFSQFIVRIDERLAAKKPSEAENAEDLILGTKKLLSPASEGATPEHPYYRLMQEHPEIAMIHAQIVRLLDGVDSPKPNINDPS
jgi:hypothetical protein